MDGTLLFTLKALGWLLGLLVGLLVGSAFAAIWLRLAASFLKLGPIKYTKAFTATLLCNFVVTCAQLSISFNHGYMAGYFGNIDRITEVKFHYPPIYFLYFLVFSYVLVAAILRCVLRREDESQVSFSDAFALAGVYNALLITSIFLIGSIVLAIVLGMLSLLVG